MRKRCRYVKPRKPSKDETKDLLVIRVGTAGIGRLRFRAYIAGGTIDRSDGDDEDTYDTPGQALAAIGAEIDQQLIQEAWAFHSKLNPGNKR